jgi:hypothetical protein
VVTTNDAHCVVYARWVLFNDEDVSLGAKEGSKMTGLGYFLLYKKCTKSEYKPAHQQATKARVSAV